MGDNSVMTMLLAIFKPQKKYCEELLWLHKQHEIIMNASDFYFIVNSICLQQLHYIPVTLHTILLNIFMAEISQFKGKINMP